MTVTFTPLPTVGVQLMSAAPGPDLVAVGYREDEYVASGRARRFDEIAPAEADFATRVLIRRPVAAGTTTLVVEWLNVSSGDDAAPDYTYVADEIVRRGHVWVGVSAQFIGVEGGRALVPTGADPGAEPSQRAQGARPAAIRRPPPPWGRLLLRHRHRDHGGTVGPCRSSTTGRTAGASAGSRWASRSRRTR